LTLEKRKNEAAYSKSTINWHFHRPTKSQAMEPGNVKTLQWQKERSKGGRRRGYRAGLVSVVSEVSENALSIIFPIRFRDVVLEDLLVVVKVAEIIERAKSLTSLT
jgi:hypothetical protein